MLLKFKAETINSKDFKTYFFDVRAVWEKIKQCYINRGIGKTIHTKDLSDFSYFFDIRAVWEEAKSLKNHN